MGQLDGKVALVTGAGKGVGRAIAEMFAREGARVAIAGRTLEPLQTMSTEIGASAYPVLLDVADPEHWQQAIAAVRGRWGKLNILVNCAGLSVTSSFEEATEESWRDHMAINLDGVFYGCRAALTLLKDSGEPASIVNVGSAFAVRPMAAFAAYSASKAGMVTLTKTIALHCAAQGYPIRANVLHPGGTETPMLEQALADTGLPRQQAYDFFAKIHPMGRLAKPEEVAQAALWLASDLSSFTTGSELSVDGGQSIRE